MILLSWCQVSFISDILKYQTGVQKSSYWTASAINLRQTNLNFIKDKEIETKQNKLNYGQN